jgi:CheY-like chemotaxis protein
MRTDVLLVEDNLGDVLLIQRAVNDLSVPVNLHLAMDGEQALLMLSNPCFEPDLIVLDLEIPKVHGTALLELWKGRGTPVVVFTSSRNPRVEEQCIASAVRAYVSKPVEFEAFNNAVRRIIGECRGIAE